MKEQKICEKIIDFFAYQGDMKLMESTLHLGVNKYGLEIGNNQLLELRIDISRAAASLSYAVNFFHV